ncbi:MAG: hypothetical protein WAX69_14125 [Victivallales bacterium]
MEKLDETKSIPLICSWCSELIGVVKWKIQQDKKISPDYGICDKCLRKISGMNCTLKNP